jgi:hypothetical protein
MVTTAIARLPVFSVFSLETGSAGVNQVCDAFLYGVFAQGWPGYDLAWWVVYRCKAAKILASALFWVGAWVVIPSERWRICRIDGRSINPYSILISNEQKKLQISGLCREVNDEHVNGRFYITITVCCSLFIAVWPDDGN